MILDWIRLTVEWCITTLFHITDRSDTTLSFLCVSSSFLNLYSIFPLSLSFLPRFPPLYSDQVREMYITFQLCVSHCSDTDVKEERLNCASLPISAYFQSTHPPWRSRPARWPQPGAHTPTSRSTLQAPGPCVAWGSPARAASRPRCSAARSRSARRGTCTGTCSWGRRFGHSDIQNRPKHKHLPHELEERDKIGKNGRVVLVWVFFFFNLTDLWTGRALPIHVTSCMQCLAKTHQRRYQSSCGCRPCIHTAALYVCHRGSFQSRPALSDGHTPSSRRSHPGSGAPQGDTKGARQGTGISEDTPGSRLV